MQAAFKCIMCAMLSCMGLCIVGLAPARAECALGKIDAPRGVATLHVMDRRGPCHGKGGVANEEMMNVLLTNRERTSQTSLLLYSWCRNQRLLVCRYTVPVAPYLPITNTPGLR